MIRFLKILLVLSLPIFLMDVSNEEAAVPSTENGITIFSGCNVNQG